MTFQPEPNPKGEREYQLRKRFELEWDAMSPTDRRPFIDRALRECSRDHAVQCEFVTGVINQYAWTLFAESCDPAEAKAIQNAGWTTTAGVDAGAVPVGGW